MRYFRILLGLLMLVQPVMGQLTYQRLEVVYDSAITFKNLQLIPVIRKGPSTSTEPQWMTLPKALQNGWVTVSERGTASTENVHFLRINNKTNRPLLISAGEVVLGGRQDRMVTRDTLLWPTGGDQYISVMCVEEDRWSEKEKKFSYFSYANPRLRSVLHQSPNQVLIWKEIYRQLDSAKIKAPTLSYSAKTLDKKMAPELLAYHQYFTSRVKVSDSTWVGMIAISGNRLIGAEIFEGTDLFYDSFEPLLQGYVEEAVWNGAVPVKKEEAIRDYLNPALSNETQQEEFIKKKGKMFRYMGRAVHLTLFGEQ